MLFSELASKIPVKKISIGKGKEAHMNTMLIMKSMIQNMSKDTFVRMTTEQVVKNLKDLREKAQMILDWVQHNTDYQRDPLGFEYIKTPNLILQQIELGIRPQLDCDDYTVLTLSMAKSVGLKTKLIAASYNNERILTHIYGAIKINNEWVPIDGTNKQRPLGWEMGNFTKKLELEV